MYRADILLFGTMGDIGPTAKTILERYNLIVALSDFPQNVFRDIAGYRRELIKALKEYEPKAVIPVGNMVALSHIKSELQALHPSTAFCVDSELHIRMLDGKVSCYEFCERIGIPQPRRYSDISHIPEGAQTIFKRDVSFGGHGVHLPKNAESLRNLIAHQPNGEPFLIEDYIEGEEYSVDALRFGDSFECSCYKSEKSSGNGPAQTRTVIRCESLEKIAQDVLCAIDYTGVCGFDFIVDRSGKPFLLECNPRLTGGLQSEADSGFDIPYYIYKNAASFCDKPQENSR